MPLEVAALTVRFVVVPAAATMLKGWVLMTGPATLAERYVLWMGGRLVASTIHAPLAPLPS